MSQPDAPSVLFIATCVSPDCPELGVGKPGFFALLSGESVMCGKCMRPCAITEPTNDGE